MDDQDYEVPFKVTGTIDKLTLSFRGGTWDPRKRNRILLKESPGIRLKCLPRAITPRVWPARTLFANCSDFKQPRLQKTINRTSEQPYLMPERQAPSLEFSGHFFAWIDTGVHVSSGS